MKNIPIVFALFFLMLQNSFSQDHKYKLIISTDKKVYEYAEDVMLKVKLINIGKQSDTVFLNYFNLNTMSSRMDIFNEKGHRLKTNQLVVSYGEFPFKLLYPHDTIDTEDELSFYAGPGHIFSRSYFTEGIYKVLLKYRYSEFIEKALVTSNTIEFTVLQIKDSEIQAFNDAKKLNEYFKDAKEPNQKEKLKACTDTASIILYKYPNSRFTQFALSNFYYTRNFLKYKYDTTTLKEIEFYFEKNPESKFLENFIHTVEDIFKQNGKSREEILEYLDYLKSKFSNTMLNEYIDEVILKNEWLKNR